jgi:hypothetical protein
MDLIMLRRFLAWASLINIGLMLWWFLFMVFARDWVYKMHSKWFPMSKDQFNAIHYSGMVFFKILVFVCFLIPYLVLRIIL